MSGPSSHVTPEGNGRGTGLALLERARSLIAPPPAYPLWLILACAAVLALLNWPVEHIAAETGLDPSWEAALYLAQRNGLDFGTEVLFTYGPLGFLTIPRFLFTPQTVAALGFIAAAHVVLAFAVLTSLSRVMHIVLAVALTHPLLRAAALIHASTLVVVVGLIACVAALRPHASPRLVTLFVPAIGAAAALVLLMKFNDGVVLTGISSVTVLALAVRLRFRLLLLYAAGFMIAFAAAWLGTGQSVLAIGPYIIGSLELAFGYSAAMGFEGAGREWEYGAAALLAFGILFLAAQASATWGWPVRAAVIGASALVMFTGFKHGFVRHDGHSIVYFVTCALVVPALFLLRSQWRTAVATAAGALVALSLASGIPITEPLDVTGRVALFAEQFSQMTDPAVRSRMFADTSEFVRRQLAIPPEVMDELRGHRVHIDPWETSIAWAHYDEFEWTPVPVFQSFSAYTDHLDDLNASFLSSPDGPDRILRQTPRSIDGRNPHWETPAYMLALLCNFREAWVEPAWQVLARIPNRCGEPRQVQKSEVIPNTPIPVPVFGEGDIIVVAIRGLEGRPIDRLGVALYKAGPVWVNVDEIFDYRIIPGTAGNGLILQVPAAANHSGGFVVPSIEQQLRVYYGWARPGTEPSLEPTLTIEFFAIPFDAGDLP